MNKTSDRYQNVFESLNEARILSLGGLIVMVVSATMGFVMLFNKPKHD